jgi:Z1 domain
LGLFAKSCYVGYTATPFANIFINHDAYDDEAREELFPRDFIYSLDAPNTYFGPHKVFLDEATSATILEPITDCEDYLPFSHKKDDSVAELPPSLYGAFHEFVLARAIRNLRGQANKHCSMMVNVSRFVSVQRTVRDFISLHEKKLRAAVKANYAMPEHISDKNAHMRALRNVFEGQYGGCEFEWEQVKAALWGALEYLRIFVVNSKTDEALDYGKYEKDGHGLTAIAIGGLSLSRGLTIEGLCVSYMYRNTQMYDTLMQMGRWFGYRPGFEDLCRVHLSKDSINWYSHIADASDELRLQINRMRRDGLSPRQFGLYVRAHPDSLLITAANKMRGGAKIMMRQNFSGRLIESYIVPSDEKINRFNEQLIESSWRDGFGGKPITQTAKGWIARDVAIEAIEEFLVRFRTHPTFSERKSDVISFLRAVAEAHPMGDVLLISVAKNSEEASSFRLGSQDRQSADRVDDSAWRMSKDRVASRGDEKLGLNEAQIKLAEDNAAEDEKSKSKEPSDVHFREVRRKPLLMVHILGPVGKDPVGNRVPAFGVSFPPGDYETEIEVVANRVWVERMHGTVLDDPDDDEDYDE